MGLISEPDRKSIRYSVNTALGWWIIYTKTLFLFWFQKINLRHIVKQFQKGCYPEEVVDTETEQLDYIYRT